MELDRKPEMGYCVMSAERRRPSDSRPDRLTVGVAVRGPGHCRRNQPPREPAADCGGRVTDAENRCEVNLRYGLPADPRAVNGVLLFLEALARRDPDQFRALLSLARGEQPTVPPSLLGAWRRAGVVATDGSVRPLFRDVLLSACRETPEGLVLASPFAPQTDAEAELIRTHVAAFEDRLARFARYLGLDRPPGDGNHER